VPAFEEGSVTEWNEEGKGGRRPERGAVLDHDPFWSPITLKHLSVTEGGHAFEKGI